MNINSINALSGVAYGTRSLISPLLVVRNLYLDNEKYMPGLRCIAAPIKEFSSRTIAAMSLSMFKHKMTAERKAFLKEVLFRASAELSEQLGFTAGSKKFGIFR